MILSIISRLIIVYQRYLSPFKGTTCRFHPSCSQYSLLALEKYGLMKGSRLSAIRLAKCHPWHPGGFDPLP